MYVVDNDTGENTEMTDKVTHNTRSGVGNSAFTYDYSVNEWVNEE